MFWLWMKAVDLAKRFCDGAGPRIINGCLRTFLKDLSGASVAQTSDANEKVEVWSETIQVTVCSGGQGSEKKNSAEEPQFEECSEW